MNWKQAFTLGLLAPGVWEGVGEATMYSYNGVVLPKLPEWDKEAYPYAVMITEINESTPEAPYGKLILLSSIATLKKTTLYWELYAAADGTAITYHCNNSAGDNDTEWIRTPDYDLEFSAGGKVISTYRAYWAFTWADFDVMNYDDGTLYLAASDPIPVYE